MSTITPTEFVLWLNGAADMMGEAPTPEQWAQVKEKFGEAVGHIAAKRLLEKGEEAVRREKEHQFELAQKQAAEAAWMKQKMQIAEAMREQQLKQAQMGIGGLGVLTSAVAGQSLLKQPVSVAGLAEQFDHDSFILQKNTK